MSQVINQSNGICLRNTAIVKSLKDINKDILETLNAMYQDTNKNFIHKVIITFDKELRKFKVYGISNDVFKDVFIKDLEIPKSEIVFQSIIEIDYHVSKLCHSLPKMKEKLKLTHIQNQLDSTPIIWFLWDILESQHTNFGLRFGNQYLKDSFKDLNKNFGVNQEQTKEFLSYLSRNKQILEWEWDASKQEDYYKERVKDNVLS